MKFPELLKDANNDDDNYENISSQLFESLFTSIPFSEMTDYILKQIHKDKELN